MKMENDESGLAVLKYAKEKNKSTEVIVITAYPEIKNADCAMGLRAFGYISKLDNDAYFLMCGKVEKALSGQHDFDVFLCYNSKDKSYVKKIAKMLKERGVLPWLDEWEFRPGDQWIDVLKEQIDNISTVAVFVGGYGKSPWRELEIELLLHEFIKKKKKIIPVILSSCKKEPELPLFLEGLDWVDFRNLSPPGPMDQLIYGITGKKISKSREGINE